MYRARKGLGAAGDVAGAFRSIMLTGTCWSADFGEAACAAASQPFQDTARMVTNMAGAFPNIIFYDPPYWTTSREDRNAQTQKAMADPEGNIAAAMAHFGLGPAGGASSPNLNTYLAVGGRGPYATGGYQALDAQGRPVQQGGATSTPIYQAAGKPNATFIYSDENRNLVYPTSSAPLGPRQPSIAQAVATGAGAGGSVFDTVAGWFGGSNVTPAAGSGTAAASGLSSIPWWVWAAGGGAALIFAMGGKR